MLALAVLAMALVARCASSPPPTPPPPAQAPEPDPVVDRLTEWLKLDAHQQTQVRQLLQELYDRNAKIREKWDRGARVHPEELVVSRGIFENGLAEILTDEQRRTYGQAKIRMQMKGRAVQPPS